MTSTGFRNSLPSTLVECVLEILQSSALSQVGQARLLQGPGLGGFSNDRSVKCIHVAAAKLFPLLRREGLGAVLLVGTRRIASAITTVVAGEARRTARSVDIRTSAAGSLLSHSDAVSTELVDRSNRP